MSRRCARTQTSILCLVRSLLHYRREHASLSEGTWRRLPADSAILAYERCHRDNRLWVVLNFTAYPQAWPVPTPAKFRIALSTYGDRCRDPVDSILSLRANEGRIIEPA